MARTDGNYEDNARAGAAGGSTGSSGIVGTVQGAASSASQAALDKAAPLVDAASEKVGDVADQAKDQATSRFEVGKEFAVESLTGIAQALRQTGQHLRQEGAQPTLGGYADTGAEQLERFTGYLRQRDTQQLVSDVEAYARRSPTMFASGAFALGLVAARFFRSSGTRAGASSMGSTPSIPPRSTGTAGTYSSGRLPVPAGTPSTGTMNAGTAGTTHMGDRSAGMTSPTSTSRPAAPTPTPTPATTPAPRTGTANSPGTPSQTSGQAPRTGDSSAQSERIDPSRSPRI